MLKIQEIFVKLQNKYPLLCGVNLKLVATDTGGASRECVGLCNSEQYGEFVQIGLGKRMRHTKTTSITVRTGHVAPDFQVFILAHECAHAITQYVEHNIDGIWYHNDHCVAFYSNFAAILRFLELEKILSLKPTKGGSKYSMANLMRLDAYDPVDSKISICEPPT